MQAPLGLLHLFFSLIFSQLLVPLLLKHNDKSINPLDEQTQKSTSTTETAVTTTTSTTEKTTEQPQKPTPLR